MMGKRKLHRRTKPLSSIPSQSTSSPSWSSSPPQPSPPNSALAQHPLKSLHRSSLRRHIIRACSKHTGHSHFIPIKHLSIQHLPAGSRSRARSLRILKVIKQLAQWVVRVRVVRDAGTVSKERMGSSMAYTCTGIVTAVRKDSVTIRVPAHAIRNDVEARHTTADFFFDHDDNTSDVIKVQGYSVKHVKGEGTAVLTCTGRLELYQRFQRAEIKKPKVRYSGDKSCNETFTKETNENLLDDLVVVDPSHQTQVQRKESLQNLTFMKHETRPNLTLRTTDEAGQNVVFVKNKVSREEEVSTEEEEAGGTAAVDGDGGNVGSVKHSWAASVSCSETSPQETHHSPHDLDLHCVAADNDDDDDDDDDDEKVCCANDTSSMSALFEAGRSGIDKFVSSVENCDQTLHEKSRTTPKVEKRSWEDSELQKGDAGKMSEICETKLSKQNRDSTCETKKLKESVDLNVLIEADDTCAVLISHPHGYPKCVSFGQFLRVEASVEDGEVNANETKQSLTKLSEDDIRQEEKKIRRKEDKRRVKDRRRRPFGESSGDATVEHSDSQNSDDSNSKNSDAPITSAPLVTSLKRPLDNDDETSGNRKLKYRQTERSWLNVSVISTMYDFFASFITVALTYVTLIFSSLFGHRDVNSQSQNTLRVIHTAASCPGSSGGAVVVIGGRAMVKLSEVLSYQISSHVGVVGETLGVAVPILD